MMGLYKNKGNRKVKLAILATLATFTTAFAGIKYDIPMMDVRDEAGSNESRLGDMCIAGKKHWGVLCVKTPSRVTIPLGGGAVSLEAVCGVDCRNEVDEPAAFRIASPDGKVLWEKSGVRKGVKLDAKVDITGLESVVLEVLGADGIMAGWASGTFVFADVPGESHGRRSLVGYSSRGHKRVGTIAHMQRGQQRLVPA